MTGHCLCGGVALAVGEPPAFVHDCNCRLCSGTGALWGYFPADAVTVAGETRGFRRGDVGEASAETHFCPTCGATTHFRGIVAANEGMAGVNMRLFDPAGLAGVERRFPDGRGWDKTGPFGYRRAAEIIDEAHPL